MIDISTNYMGIKLKNPVIIGASNLVQDEKNLHKMEKAGAAAIVYKSLFEEQIQLESLELQQELETYNNWDAETASIFPDVEHAGPREYLMKLRKAKQAVGIPLFASLNAVYDASWIEYAQKIEETGVDGLELNFYAHNIDFNRDGTSIVEEQVRILKEVRSAIKIPVSVKLSPYYSNTLKVIRKMDLAGAKGFVLFNRLFQPDIDIYKEEHHFPYNLSSPVDSRLAIRYCGLLYGQVNGSVCASNGIFSGEDVIKVLLAGADVVQVVSAIYRKGIKQISEILQALEAWMEQKGYSTLDDFRGKLSREKVVSPFTYKRAQYVDILMKSDKILEQHPMDAIMDWEED